MQGFGLLVILFFFGLAGGMVGRMKGSSFVIWFLVSFCVPFIGLVAAVCYRWDRDELEGVVMPIWCSPHLVSALAQGPNSVAASPSRRPMRIAPSPRPTRIAPTPRPQGT